MPLYRCWWHTPDPWPAAPDRARPRTIDLTELAALHPNEKRARWAHIRTTDPHLAEQLAAAAPAVLADPVVRMLLDQFSGRVHLIIDDTE